jgi:hypothetical protein
MGEGMARIVRNGARNESILTMMYEYDAFDCDDRWRNRCFVVVVKVLEIRGKRLNGDK